MVVSTGAEGKEEDQRTEEFAEGEIGGGGIIHTQLQFKCN